MNIERYKSLVHAVPDFPKPGVLFRDISPLIENGLTDVARDMLSLCPNEFDLFAGIESRGFLFASAMAAISGKAGVVMVRKAGKLPPPVESINFDCEYASEKIEVKRAVKPHQRVVLVDDCAALGNTFRAAVELLGRAGYDVVGKVALFRIMNLPGDKSDIKALWDYE